MHHIIVAEGIIINNNIKSTPSGSAMMIFLTSTLLSGQVAVGVNNVAAEIKECQTQLIFILIIMHYYALLLSRSFKTYIIVQGYRL